jgi:hypothetical protein
MVPQPTLMQRGAPRPGVLEHDAGVVSAAQCCRALEISGGGGYEAGSGSGSIFSVGECVEHVLGAKAELAGANDANLV